MEEIMALNINTAQPRLIRIAWFFVAFLLISVLLPKSVSAQSISTHNFGVGSGDGLEIGINVDSVQALRADIEAGVYDRLCTAEEHDRTKWHSLINIERKCHYDHQHIDDPNYVNDIFGEPGAWFGRPGQSISYPWQTFPAQSSTEGNDKYVSEKRMENDLKHEGYVWIVRRDQECPAGNCVRDFRLQTHAIFGAHDMPVRYHSFSLEARLCANGNDLSTCGIVRYGGWIDMGRLFTTAANDISCLHDVNEIFIPVAGDNQFFPIDRPEARDEIRCHPNVTRLPSYPPSDPLAEWWGHAGGETRFQLRSFDPIGNVNPQNPAEWNFFCAKDDVNCRFDQTIMSVFIGYTLHIHEFVGNNERGEAIRVDNDGNGRTDFRGYFTRWGGLNRSCTAAGLDCVPFQYDNVVLNFFNNKEARYSQTVCDSCQPFDHDISRSGQKWNTWFYRYAQGHNHTPTPTPTTELTPEVTAEPTAEPTVDPTTPSVRVDVNPATADVSGQVAVTLNLFNVTDLYGIQTQCTVDPNILTGVSRTDGDGFSSGNSFYVDSGYQADGTWMVAASRLQPNPAISGSVSAFTLNYTAQNAGTSAVNCAVMGVDSNGNELQLDVINSTLTVGSPTAVPTVQPTVAPTTAPTIAPTTQPTAVPTSAPTSEPTAVATAEVTPEVTPEPGLLGTISGVVTYQNSPDNAGITVALRSGDTAIVSLVTNADGGFNFTDVPAGEYSLLLSAPQHISVIRAVSVLGDGMVVDASSQTLRAGDTDNNQTIDILDATFIGANFGLETLAEISNADLNRDGQINISDLVLVGGNFGLTGPITAE
jgi:hypothetical protein